MIMKKKKEKEKHFRSKFTKNENLVIIYARWAEVDGNLYN